MLPGGRELIDTLRANSQHNHSCLKGSLGGAGRLESFRPGRRQVIQRCWIPTFPWLHSPHS